MTAARRLRELDSRLVSGVVVETSPRLQVRIGEELYSVLRAKSCLVAPEQRDRVLCAIEHDAVFVLAVLSGAEGATTRVTAAGDELSIEARQITIRAEAGTVAVDRLGVFGSLVNAQVRKVVLLADQLDAVAERIAQRAKRVFRFVEDVDQLRAGIVDIRAESLAAIRAENALISARVLAKIDGEQINLG
ncbi:MAG: DUF3540 domain-containing protein [Myxococcales bacterium]|nr:DUF3540 domain-containing protein [Myxococcales bacterium]